MFLISYLIIVSHFSQKPCLMEKFETIKRGAMYTLIHPCICHLLPCIKKSWSVIQKYDDSVDYICDIVNT